MEERIYTRKELVIIFFIYLSVFLSSWVFFKEPFEFHFGYLIYIVLLPSFVFRYGANRTLFFVFIILFLNGFLNIILGNNTAGQFFKVSIGLTLAYFFYYYVIQAFDQNVEQLFKWYLKGSYIVAIIGLIQFVSYQIGFTPGYNFQWILNKWSVIYGGNFGIRVNSIFGEPTFLAASLSAAFFASVNNLIRKEPVYISKRQSIVIILVYILSFSGLGQTGIFLTLILLIINFGLIRYIFVIIPVLIWLFNLLHDNVKEFRERYDSLIELFTTGKFVLGKTHGSSFILYNNYKVAMENFKTNFLFGTGIGSHPVAFDKFSIAKDIQQFGFNLNSADANSMLLRLISETGLFGVGIFFYIIIKCYVKRNMQFDSNHWIVSNSILVMILLNLFRQGHYFINGFPLFVLLYIYNSIDYKKFLESQTLITDVSKA